MEIFSITWFEPWFCMNFEVLDLSEDDEIIKGHVRGGISRSTASCSSPDLHLSRCSSENQWKVRQTGWMRLRNSWNLALFDWLVHSLSPPSRHVPSITYNNRRQAPIQRLILYWASLIIAESLLFHRHYTAKLFRVPWLNSFVEGAHNSFWCLRFRSMAWLPRTRPKMQEWFALRLSNWSRL